MKTAVIRLLPSLLLAACIALVLRFEPFSSSDSGFVFEAQLAADSTAEMHLFFDFGSGFRRESTRDFWMVESAKPRTYRIPLPRSVIRSLSIASTENQARFKLLSARIVNSEGQVMISLAQPNAAWAPGFTAKLAEPLSTIPPEEASWTWSVIQFAALAALFALLSRWMAGREISWRERYSAWWRRRWKWCEARPALSLFIVAVLAVLVSCHPVIFFGQSFASPNNGALCLYDSFPTIPGAADSPVETWNSSDVRSLLWEHLPYAEFERKAIFRDHELPLWLRDDMCGLPLLGQGQSMVGDPLQWISILSHGAAWAWDVKTLLARLLFCFGIGLVVLAATKHLPASLLLAFSSAFIGFFSYRFTHPAALSLSYSPWILLCWLRAASAPSWRRAAVWALVSIGANWMELSSGTAKEASMLLIVLNGLGALILLLRDAPWRERARRFLTMASGAALFSAISAPLWMIFLDCLRTSASAYDIPNADQMQPGLLLGLFDELFYRELMPAEWHIDPSVNFFVLLGVIWAFADFNRLRKDRTFLIVVLGSLPLLGLIFGVAPRQWLMTLPFIKNIWHLDNTFSCPLFILLFVLAGFGIRNCAAKLRSDAAWKADWRRTLIILGMLAATYFGSANAHARWPSFAVQASRMFEPSPFFIGYCSALFAALAILPIAARRLALGSGSRVMFGTAVIVALFAVHFRHGMWLATKFDYYVMNPRERMDLNARSPAVDFVLSRQNEPGRVGSIGAVLRPGFNGVYGLETCTGANPITNRWYGEWLDAAGFSKSWMSTSEIPAGNPRAVRPFYDAMNVRYFLASNARLEPPPAGLQQRAQRDLQVYESPTAWPRAFFTNRASLYQNATELADLIEHGDGRPLAGVQDYSPDIASLGSDQASREIVPARNYRLTANSTSFELDAPGPGLAVLTEAWEGENFRVSVNGMPAKYLRVNHAFKGVLLPGAGRFAVVFSYWPRLLTLALWISAAGFIILILASVAVFSRFRRVA